VNIKNCRLRAGLTQKELAEKAGTSPKSISVWENELFEPRISSLELIANALGVTLDFIIQKETPLIYSKRKLEMLIDEDGEQNFCDATDITPMQVWRWRHSATPTMPTLRRLAEHFQVPVGWFFEHEEKKESETK